MYEYYLYEKHWPATCALLREMNDGKDSSTYSKWHDQSIRPGCSIALFWLKASCRPSRLHTHWKSAFSSSLIMMNLSSLGRLHWKFADWLTRTKIAIWLIVCGHQLVQHIIMTLRVWLWSWSVHCCFYCLFFLTNLSIRCSNIAGFSAIQVEWIGPFLWPSVSVTRNWTRFHMFYFSQWCHFVVDQGRNVANSLVGKMAFYDDAK